jgi:hypothetical protein
LGVIRAEQRQEGKNNRRFILIKYRLWNAERNLKESLVTCYDISSFGKTEQNIIANSIDVVQETKKVLESKFNAKPKEKMENDEE